MVSARYEQWKDDVKAANPLLDIVRGDARDLKPAGRHRWLGCSPLRGDKNPSFYVFPEEDIGGRWHDFGTGDRGDVIDYVMARDGVDFRTAIDRLADRAGMKWSGSNGGGEHDPEIEEEITRVVERRLVEKIATEAADYYHLNLTGEARAHLQSHYGFTDKTIDKQKIGWGTGELFEYLRSRGYTVNDILKTGMFIRTQGGRVIEHHEDRITFPYLRRGYAPYMISRRLDGVTPDTQYQVAKYKKTLTQSDNHPYVSRHVRNDIFYGEDTARRKVDILAITEGVTDAITAIQCGIPTISPVTTRFKDSEIERCVQMSGNANTVVIVNDHEDPRPHPKSPGKTIQPGLDGAAKSAKALFDAGRDARIVVLPIPDGQDKIDLNEYVRDNGKDELLDQVAKAMPYPEFLISRVPLDTRPVELDEKLSPAYAVIASCSPTEREAYINVICHRFKLTHGTVVEAVAEFLRSRKETTIVPPPPDTDRSPGVGDGGAPPAPPSSGSGGTSSGDGGSGSLPPDHIGDIFGAVEEDPDGYYFVTKRTRKGDFYEERISNFVLTPKKIVRLDDGQRVCCDIRCVNGMVIRDVIFSDRAFRSAKDFKGEVKSRSNLFTWSGKDQNVEGVVELLTQQPMEEFKGVPTLGYVEVEGKPRWVMPDYVLGPDGRVINSNVIYAPIQKPGLADCIELEGATLDAAEIRALAQRLLPMIFSLNTPDVILPLLGWFSAAAATPIIREMLGHMAVLWIWGTQGSGKTSIVRDIFWRMCCGVKSEPFSCTDTVFTLINVFSCSTSVPTVYDEYKHDMPQKQQDAFLRMVRKVYSSEQEKRGRPDLRVVEYKLVAPVCVIGEMMPTQPAILERIVCVSPLKHDITAEGRRNLARVTSEPLHLLGGHFIQFVLGRDLRKDLRTAESIMDTELLPTLKEPLPPRIRDNLLIVTFGDYLHRQWCDEIGVKIPKRPKIKDVFPKLVANITATEDGGGVKDSFDHFVEAMSTYAHLGLIRENIHYAIVNDMLCLHLESCYQVYLVERRRANQPDATNGLTALKRVIREKHAQGGYIVNRSHRVRFTPPGGGPVRQVRCITIDPDMVPDHVHVDQFPVSTNRTQGGHQRSFEKWGDN